MTQGNSVIQSTTPSGTRSSWRHANRAESDLLNPAEKPKLWLTDLERHGGLLERFRGFRNKLLSEQNGGARKVFVLTGAEKSVGASTTAFNIGLSFGLEMGNEKTVIVDANFRRPVLHATFNTPAGPGLLDYLQGRAGIEKIVLPSYLPRLSLIHMGESTSDGGLLFSPDAVARFLKEVRERFDFVIIDTAPILQSGQTDMIASLADGTILVVEASRTRAEVVGAVQDQMKNSGSKLIAAFLNKRKFVIPEWLYRYV